MNMMTGQMEIAQEPDRNERLPAGTFDRQTVEHLHRYAVAQSFVSGLDVLDIACGEGYGSNLLSQVAKTVVGVDVDSDAVNRAKIKYQQSNLTFLHGTGTNIALPSDSFDLIVSFETLEHLVEQDEMLGELRRVLRRDGMLVMSTPDKLEYSDKTGHKNPYHVRELYKDEFVSLVSRHFKYVTLYKQKLMLSSAIAPAERVESLFEIFSGGMSQVSRTGDLVGAKYNLLLASDQAPVRMNFSLFDGQPALDDLVKSHYRAIHLEGRVAGLTKQLEDLRKSRRFRVGQALTAPMRWFRG